jgi:hypothetical protein
MYAVSRNIGAALIGALVAAALALTMTAQAHAADQTVKLTQIRPVTGSDYALTASLYPPTGVIYVNATIRNDKPSVPTQRWIKHDKGNGYATYESVKYPGQCMQTLTSLGDERLSVGPCQPGNSHQMWSRGFGSGTYRPFENLASSRAATSHVDGTTHVVQQLYNGLQTQGWALVVL